MLLQDTYKRHMKCKNMWKIIQEFIVWVGYEYVF